MLNTMDSLVLIIDIQEKTYGYVKSRHKRTDAQ